MRSAKEDSAWFIVEPRCVSDVHLSMGSAIDATALEVLMERGHMSENLGIETVELSDESVAVKWNDGHDSVYNAKYLRVSCSCAQCIEEWSRRKILDPATVPADLRSD